MSYLLSKSGACLSILRSKVGRAWVFSPQQNPGTMFQGRHFCHPFEILLILDFWVKKIKGEHHPLQVTRGDWWSRNVYSLGTNSPEINEGAIVGGGGTRGGFESKLKRNTERPSRALGDLGEGFLLCYFGFEMELKTYFGLTRPGQRGESHRNPGNNYYLTRLGVQRGSPKDTGCPELTRSPRYRESWGHGERRHAWKGDRNTKSISGT